MQMTSSPPKAPAPNTIILGVRFQHVNFGGDTNIPSVALYCIDEDSEAQREEVTCQDQVTVSGTGFEHRYLALRSLLCETSAISDQII